MRPHKRTGTVYLVGAGPGDPELITVRGLNAIRTADALVYDRLVHPALLDEAPARAERIYAGKAPGSVAMEQADIERLLVHLAHRHERVVRLKGGDPFVFGRGGEEALTLREAGIAFEIVPGISSSIAAPAYAGIPVTHRERARGFTVVTGHTCRPDEMPDWAALARATTLIVLMGLGRLREIAGGLLANGLSAETPVAVISRAATAQQETVGGTLATIAERAAHLASPATIVIGEVAAIHERLAWYDTSDTAGIERMRAPFSDHLVALSA
ncbi:MAG: uroporphyrinogen-III C-methyltransferase [Rhodothermales bacterium]